MKDCSCEIKDEERGCGLASSEEGRVQQSEQLVIVKHEQASGGKMERIDVPDISSSLLMYLGGIVNYLRLAPGLIKKLVIIAVNLSSSKHDNIIVEAGHHIKWSKLILRARSWGLQLLIRLTLREKQLSR